MHGPGSTLSLSPHPSGKRLILETRTLSIIQIPEVVKRLAGAGSCRSSLALRHPGMKDFDEDPDERFQMAVPGLLFLPGA